MIFKLTQYRLKQLYYIYNIYPVEFKQKKEDFWLITMQSTIDIRYY